jgi:hypothetical protein
MWVGKSNQIVKRFWTIALLMSLLAAAVFWRLNQSPPAPKATALLPETTVLLLEFPDFARTCASFPKTAAYALWREPQVQALAHDVNRAFMESLGAPKGKRRHESFIASALEPAKGEVFLAFTELSLQPRLGFKAVLGLDVRRNLLVTKIALAYREFRIRTWNRTARFYTKKHSGVAYRVWELNPQLRVHHAFLNSLLVYTLDEELLRAMIERFAGQTRGSFTPTPSRPEFVAYANPALIRNAWPWLTRSKPITLSTTFLGSQIRDVRFSHGKTNMPPLPRFQTMIFTIPQTVFYRVGVTDWESGYREFADSLAASGDRDSVSRLSRFERTLRQNGIRPEEDLFRKLGPETALLANWRAGARLPDVALVVELQDPDTMRLRLDVAMTALKAATDNPPLWDVTQFHDETLRTLRLRTSAFAPTYFTTDKFFVLASSPDFARELVGQLKELAPSLAMNAGYQEAMKHLPTNAVAYTYCNLRAVAPPLLAALHNDKLPSPETLARHLSPLVSATLGDTTITISPLGEPATVAFGALAAYFAVSQAVPTTSSSTKPPGNPTAPSQTPAR